MSAPAPFPITDADVRSEIVRSRRTLFVEAGAGTGKTTTLVARLVELVRSGVHLREIAAITFTEAAAAELRARTRLELERARRDATDLFTPATFDDALAELDDAPITTLHGFAQRILTAHPLEAGLPPGFEVLDEIAAEADFDEAWTTFLDELYADPAFERALVVLHGFGVRADRLREMARVLVDNHDRLLADDDASRTLPAVPAVDLTATITAIDAATAHVSAARDDADALVAHLHGLAAWRARLATAQEAGDELALLEACADAVTTKFEKQRIGRQQSWPDGVRKAICAALAEIDRAFTADLQAVRAPALDALLAALQRFARESFASRRRRGRLIFHDLLVLARDLLQRDAAVRAALREQIRHLLLDEFQDTDPLQIEIAVLLASGGDPDQHWSAHELDEGRLFVVGDPKQAIYRFRRADVEQYLRASDAFATQRLALSSNFRSRCGIVDFVNATFGDLMAAASQQRTQAPYAPLAPTREPCREVDVPVQVIGVEEHPKRTPASDVRTVEAREVAAWVRRAVDEGWPVTDRSGPPGTTRPARFADVAILLPTRTGLPYLERAFDDLAIPMRIESQSLLFATAEVHDLLAVLAAIDDPTDDTAVVAALRSAAFACRDRDLVEWAAAGGRWDYRAPRPSDVGSDHPVAEAMEALDALHDARWWTSVSELVERVVRERRLLELGAAHRRPRDHWRRTQFVVDLARSFASTAGVDLRGFVRWMREQVDQEARRVEVVVPEPDDDAVRVLTVHGAKGLEFPIVVLAGTNVAPRKGTERVLWIEGDLVARLDGGRNDPRPWQSTRWVCALDQEERHVDAEQVRLLYVACTRAEDHLLLSTHRLPGSQPTGASRLAGALAARPDLWRPADITPSGTAADAAPTGADRAAPAATGADDADAEHEGADALERWWHERSTRIARRGRLPTTAPTTLARDAADGREPHDEQPAYRRGRAGTAVGRAVHAVLQSIDLATGAGLEGAVRAQALAEGVPELDDTIAALARGALAAPIVAEAVASARRWREVPVVVPVEGVLVEGYIDLLFEDVDGHLVVVDWKTDAVRSAADVDAKLAGYRIQGATYALALESALGRPVSRCAFVFASPKGAVERVIDDLAGAIEEVRALVRTEAEAATP